MERTLKTTRWLIAAALGIVSAACAAAGSEPTPEMRQALAPTGKLRVGLYVGGPTSLIQGATPDESKGVGFDLGKDLARRIGVPFEPVVYPSPGGVVGGLKSKEWDIAFLGLSPERMGVIDFTAPFLVVEHGYIVPAGSPISTIAAVDRPGIRVAALQGGSVNAVLVKTLKNATVVASPNLAAGAEMLRAGKVDAFAANKANLFELADRLPGSRVLEGRIGADEVAIALPKGREAGLAYVRQYIEDAKSDGLVKAAVQRAGLRGAVDR